MTQIIVLPHGELCPEGAVIEAEAGKSVTSTTFSWDLFAQAGDTATTKTAKPTNDYKGNIYDIKGERHIESVEGDYDALEEFKIGKSYGCIMVSNDAYADLSNTFYCSVAYMLEKSPLRNKKAAEARK